jgi:DNA-binding HxlR family transcriptional regulator
MCYSNNYGTIEHDRGLGMLAEKKRQFTEIKRELPEITQRVLTLQLRELEADGIISRTSVT